MIKCNLLKISFVCNFRSEIFSFLPLISNLVSIGLSFLLLSISAIISSNTISVFTCFIWIVFFKTIEILLHMDLYKIHKFCQYLVHDLLD